MSEDLREKNKKAAEKQKVASAKNEKKEEVTSQIYSADTDDLSKKLSNKNAEYVFKLNKRLLDDGFKEEEAKEVIDGMLPEMIDNQIKGIPANQLYGPVTQKAKEIAHPVKKPKKTPFWGLWIDTALLFFALFGLLYGVVALTSKKTDPNNQTGILTLIVLSLMWGALLTWFNNQMRMPKSERPGWGKTIGYLALGLVLMFVFLGAMAFVPTTINPTLNAVGYFVAAVVAYGIRFAFRRYMGIKEKTFF
ncbi:hypothetical protein FD33_GL000550 [Companilactobacillus paralimentarius DSM 13238 = JCM 10415]|uniref:DUF1129 domain-containing protein n=3 Tax=Companilactobacillus TaxID=2767879 RepID=A0ABR5NX89_9LACO|nr:MULTISPECIES: DUF1129 family protein [Companilactobacillus]KAE9559913.1 hypothetical protein ATN91_10480 [Companilactobacillus kimchii]KAE9563872.1 hypothetical protein ATN96_09955 [Companilactobacillus paralimentarius]KRK53425.1 hypothetical protein FC97_GL000145 [Companilactobacillus kimchii DSM 13961 = JCM 10707]KRL32386.1 hypothetical protein FD33_GL000550 [Companilactobacillus paralimentarius DSM 13238 = JCM 10415]MDR4932832.1 DUF1129 family protein [Companilactobacillus paralimentariu